MISAQVDGDNIIVVGDGIDSVKLTIMLRKKMGPMHFLTMLKLDEKKRRRKRRRKLSRVFKK